MAKERRKNTESVQSNDAAPSHDDIARRAHEIWLERGGDVGHELEDWLAAEQELSTRRRRRVETRERVATP